MTIAIADRQRFGRRAGHAADAVRAKLCALESGDTHVLESVSLSHSGCEIEHLVIGPAGIFTVAVHDDRAHEIRVDHYGMTLDGVAVPYLRQAKFEAEQVARVLGNHLIFDVPVYACLVLTGSHASQVHYDRRPSGVSVLEKADVPRWFRRQPIALDADHTRAVYEIALQLPSA